MPSSGALDQLQHEHLHQVYELNRAFLGLLQARLRQHRSPLGLPAAAHAPLAAAGGSLLESAAEFPRTLFQLHPSSTACLADGAATDFDEAEQRLCFSVLFAARQTSRQSAYHARLLFGLAPADVERLRAASLADLHQLASMPGVVECEFRDREWFWPTLMTASRPELRRRLTLMAFQPSLAVAWPRRRPPHTAA